MTFRAATTNAGETDNPAAPPPSGVVSGDYQLALVIVSVSSGSGEITASPTGWNLIAALDGATAQGSYQAALYETTTATGTAVWTIETSWPWVVHRLAWHSVGARNGAAQIVERTSVSTSISTPAVTSPGAGATVIGFVVQNPNVTSEVSYSPPAGWVERTDSWFFASGDDEVTAGSVAEFTTTGAGSVSGTFTSSEPEEAIAGALVLEATFTIVDGTGAAPLGGLSAQASGTRTTTGTASAALGALTGAAQGTRTTHGTGTAHLGALSVAASGTRTTTGTGTAPLGELTATAAGQRVGTGTGAAPLGGLDASAAGTRVVTGTASAPLGGLVATAEALPEVVTGTGTAPLGGLIASAVGTRTTHGTGTARLGGLNASAIGVVEVDGSGTAPLGGLVASASGTRIVHGAATASLGSLVATAQGESTSVITGTGVALLGGLVAFAFGSVQDGEPPEPHAGLPMVVATVLSRPPRVVVVARSEAPLVAAGFRAGSPVATAEVRAGTPVQVVAVRAGTPDVRLPAP